MGRSGRKRNRTDNKSIEKKKKLSLGTNEENVQTEKNLLNDSLLTLYKKQLPMKPSESTVVPNENVSENTSICAPVDEDADGTDRPASMDLQSPSSRKESCMQKRKSEVPEKSKPEKKKHTTLTLKHSSITFEDIGGMNKILKDVLKLFIHMKDPELFEELGVRPVRGFLLHGPPGCGKTYLARAIAGELQLPYIEVAAPELVCGISGVSESKIRDMFDEAIKSSPCILFIDEIDAVSPKRETSERGMERRMVAQLLKCLDELNEKDITSRVMVIGATNRPDSIDPALRRGGRFDREIAIGIPDESARLQILDVLCKKIKLDPRFDLHWLAHHTPGYVGADLNSLITEAIEVGIWRMYTKFINSSFHKSKAVSDVGSSKLLNKIKLDTQADELSLEAVQFWFKSKLKIPEKETKKLYFELQDFQVALQNCVPYSKREGFATVPDVTWDDVGALSEVQKQLQAAILWPVKYRKLYEKSHMSSTNGILLYGPKGCGKTLLAKAIANECSINFLSVKGPELLSMYLGESEKAVRQCFQRARNSAPCVIFFDELDALCPTRSSSNVNAAAERVVNQMLTEMDGMEERKQVFVVGATNRLEKIDSAMLRPGRLEKIIYVDIPSPAGRVEILKRVTKNKTRPKIAEDIDLKTIGLDLRCSDFSGADLAYLIREAFFKAMDDHINSSSALEEVEINLNHFDHAFKVVKPSITEKDRKYFRNHPVYSP